MPLLFKIRDAEERSLIRSGEYEQPVLTPPSIERMQQLFRVVKHELHWYIDSTHTAPTGTACNIDGTVVSREWILNKLAPPLPAGISMTARGTFRARHMFNGKRVNLGYFKTMQAAVNAINRRKEAV